MHKFLRAIGFSDIRKKDLDIILEEVIEHPEIMRVTKDSQGNEFAEFLKYYGEDIGILVRGSYDENDIFQTNYYVPFSLFDRVSTQEQIDIEKHAEKESYAGVCDEVRLGVTLIFYLQNMIDYVRIKDSGKLPVRGTSLCLSALSIEGMVMMPIKKNDRQKETIKKKTNNRYRLIQAAREGDEKAIESLTLDDMDTYSFISRRVLNEDIFSIVDSYFMPYGAECDQYSILGEITECTKIKNELTGEQVYLMNINCNEVYFDLCINEQDIYGEPEVGRRFKGYIWLQGFINFP